MIRNILIIAGCLFVGFVVWSGWSAHQNKQRFEAVMAEHAKDQPAPR